MTRNWRKHPPGRLMARTLELLQNTEQTQLDIFAATGISPDWLTRFATGKIADPGVNRVECLFRHLGGSFMTCFATDE